MKTVTEYLLKPLDDGLFPTEFEMDLPKKAKIIAVTMTDIGLEFSVVANPNKPMSTRQFIHIKEGDAVNRNYKFVGCWASSQVTIYIFEVLAEKPEEQRLYPKMGSWRPRGGVVR